MSVLDTAAVKRVRDALTGAGLDDTVKELTGSATRPEQAAKHLGIEPGAFVETRMYMVGDVGVLMLTAGDHTGKPDQLPAALNLRNKAVTEPFSAEVRTQTGFPISGISPIGTVEALPAVIDRSIKRFETVWARAGHPMCVFSIAPKDLISLNGGLVSAAIASPAAGDGPIMMKA